MKTKQNGKMKNGNALLVLSVVCTMALVGCGGGGGSSADTSSGGTIDPIVIDTPKVELKSCITKSASPTYTCATTCAETEMDVLGATYTSLGACETASAEWISAFNYSPDVAGSVAQKEGFNYINNIRVNAGLPALKYSTALETATESHENYIGDAFDKHYVAISHYEDNVAYPSPYYTGIFPADRAKYAGYGGAIGEVISYQPSGDIIESMDVLLSAVYHRNILLSNYSSEIAVGGNEQKFVRKAQPHLLGINWESSTFLMATSKDIVAYPYDGETDVRRVFYEESPDPLPNTSMSGYPISVEFNPTDTVAVEVISFKLFEEDGTEVTNTLTMDADTDHNKLLTSYQFALFPLDVLKASHTYSVELVYVKDGVEGSKTWSFTTRAVLEQNI